MVCLVTAALGWEGTTVPAGERTRELRSYRVTEHAPVIRGRLDKALDRALEASFRKALLAALRDSGFAERHDPDSAAWLSGILGRASDFVASYRILSHRESEGFLTLAVEVQIYVGRIRAAVTASARAPAFLPARLLVIVETFPLSDSAGGEDIDAGSLAARALEAELVRRGGSLVPSPDSLPWQHLTGRVAAENVVALAAAEGRRLEADYVVLGKLERRADHLLLLTVRLLSVPAEGTILSLTSPVEIQAGQAPEDSFVPPSGEIAQRLERWLAGRQEGLR